MGSVSDVRDQSLCQLSTSPLETTLRYLQSFVFISQLWITLAIIYTSVLIACRFWTLCPGYFSSFQQYQFIFQVKFEWVYVKFKLFYFEEGIIILIKCNLIKERFSVTQKLDQVFWTIRKIILEVDNLSNCVTPWACTTGNYYISHCHVEKSWR